MPQTTRRLFVRLALQNLGRRRTRTLLLALAVALGSGSVFGLLVLLHGIERSMTVGFQRLGADLIVVPEATMVNLTGALLTVEPTA
jgi:putative ABC transport system permease protein